MSYRFDLKVAQETLLNPSLALPGFSQTPFDARSFAVAGVDEAGRGPLAGPVVAAAVILPRRPQIACLRDSKVVPAEQREALFWEIQETAVAHAIVVIEPDVIDAVNIFQASMQAMREAVAQLGATPDLVLVDGNQKPRSGIKEVAIVKGDSKSAAIMAASILAKVTRDHIMWEEHQKYPQYGFAKHKGYSCKEHIEMLMKHGPCPIHRRSFEPVVAALRYHEETAVVDESLHQTLDAQQLFPLQ